VLFVYAEEGEGVCFIDGQELKESMNNMRTVQLRVTRRASLL
jgi:hypothetical protein